MLRTDPIQDRSQATLSRILDTTEELIDEVGVFNLQTGEIAKRAGVSIGTLYRYFHSTNDILDELAPGLEDLVQDAYHEKRKEQRSVGQPQADR